MPIATTAQAAQDQLSLVQVDEMVKRIAIPPRPSLLVDLQTEISGDDPDPRRIARIVAMDVAMTAAVLRSVNSPFYGLSRRAESLEQAIALLGLRQIGALVTGLVVRKAIQAGGANLTRFWDVSAKRSFALSQLAKGLRSVEVDLAQSFGLFCDVGIPLMMQRFPDYGATLKAANETLDKSFTEVEHERHDADHALIGALMARSWGLSNDVAMAIRLHHDYECFSDPNVPQVVERLIAMGLLAEAAIQRFAGMNASTEWTKGGDWVAGPLLLSEADIEDWIDRLRQDFANGDA